MKKPLTLIILFLLVNLFLVAAFFCLIGTRSLGWTVLQLDTTFPKTNVEIAGQAFPIGEDSRLEIISTNRLSILDVQNTPAYRVNARVYGEFRTFFSLQTFSLKQTFSVSPEEAAPVLLKVAAVPSDATYELSGSCLTFAAGN